MTPQEAEGLFSTWVMLSMACVKLEAGRHQEWVLHVTGTCGLAGHGVSFRVTSNSLQAIWPEAMKALDFTDAELDQLKKLNKSA